MSVTFFLDDWFDSVVNVVPICPSSWRISVIGEVAVSANFRRMSLPMISLLSFLPRCASQSVDVSTPNSASTLKDQARALNVRNLFNNQTLLNIKQKMNKNKNRTCTMRLINVWETCYMLHIPGEQFYFFGRQSHVDREKFHLTTSILFLFQFYQHGVV